MVTSVTKTLLLQASPRDWVAAGAMGEPIGVNPAKGVLFGSGVELKDSVGSAPPATAVPAAAAGNANVARGVDVSVGIEVAEGAARAVSVSCADICPMAVVTAAVLIALTSTSGAGVAPMLQAASVRAAVSKIVRVCRGNFRTSILL